jgi:hypothetical protein
METVALKVSKVFKITGAYAHVSISNDAFNAIKGIKPVMAYTTARNRDGRGVRIFDFNGTKVFSCFEKSTVEGEFGKAKLLMLAVDATALKAQADAERAGEEVLEFGADAIAQVEA